MALTDDQIRLASLALGLRLGEQPGQPRLFAVHDDDFLAAHALCEAGWLDRHAGEHDVLWRASDAALVAGALSSLATGATASPN